uniref:Uncharacterized protein n=1 Tax=Kalanchoe fedtschenkoi TaxID=63787 RepID=A0A7N0TZD3_KALFE
MKISFLPLQFMSNKRSPNTEHHTCVQASFHDSENHTTLNDTNSSLLRKSRNVVFKHILKSFNQNGSGVEGCLKAAFEYHGKNSSAGKEYTSVNYPLSEGLVPSATSRAIDGNSYVDFDGTSCCSSTELCQRAFSDIMASGEFASLCKLVSENFDGVKVEKLFDCSLIDRRIKEGAYERMPMLFPSDIHQFWKKLERVGTEMASFARSFSNRSKTFCKQFSTQGFDSHDNANHPDVFAEVGEKSGVKELSICLLCREMYHKPALKGTSSRNGYCSQCIANKTGLPHENCAVCEKLQSPEVVMDVAGDTVTITDEEVSTDHEESSYCDMEEKSCNICSIEITKDDRYQVCGHKFCRGRFYHERCLTIQQQKSYASCWYCPSCLCRICLTDTDDERIVLCDCCDHGYHIHCLNPPLSSIPKGSWYCAACDAGMTEIARVRTAYMSGAKNRKKDNEDCKEAVGQLRKKQKILMSRSYPVNAEEMDV